MHIDPNTVIYRSYIVNTQKQGSSVAKNTIYPTVHLESLPDDADAGAALFAMFTEAGSLAVFKPDHFDENNPSYIIKGIIDGKDHTEEIFINHVDVTNASFIEIAALQVHLAEAGKISKVDLGMFSGSSENQTEGHNFFEKTNCLGLLQSTYHNNLALHNYRVTQYLDKIIYEMSK